MNGTKRSGIDPVSWAKKLQELGVGEIVVNSVDRDGQMNGYDFDLIDPIREAVTSPLTILGGASSLEDLSVLFRKYGIIGAAAGSIFVFKGKYRAVLINYPSAAEKEKLFDLSPKFETNSTVS